MDKRFMRLMGAGMVLGLATTAIVMAPGERHTEAAVAVIDKTNIEHAYNTLLETIKIYEMDFAQLQLLIANAKKIDLSKIAKFELESELQRIKNEGDWRHIAVESTDLGLPPGASSEQLKAWMAEHGKNNKIDGDLTGFMETGVEWSHYLGDVNAVLEGNISVSQSVRNEKRRQDAINKTTKSVTQAAQNTQKRNEDILETIDKEIKALDDPDASAVQIMQHSAHINALQTTAMINGFSAIGKSLQAETAYLGAENARRAEAEAIADGIRANAAKAADSIDIGNKK